MYDEPYCRLRLTGGRKRTQHVQQQLPCIVIALIVLLLFGGKKIPELMKGIGKGVRSFKEGMNNIEKDIENPDPDPKDKTNH